MENLTVIISAISTAGTAIIGAIGAVILGMKKLSKPNPSLIAKNAILEKALSLALTQKQEEIKPVILEIINEYNKSAIDEYKINLKI